DTDFKLKESPRNFGVLGDVNEPLLARAIQHISGLGRLSSNFNTGETEIKNTVDAKFLDNDMYL
ncbi:MAG: peptidase S41, partial [Gelidibacter sp.]|nr:peptidase S41 [Gelidibacter sp.]